MNFIGRDTFEKSPVKYNIYPDKFIPNHMISETIKINNLKNNKSKIYVFHLLLMLGSLVRHLRIKSNLK